MILPHSLSKPSFLRARLGRLLAAARRWSLPIGALALTLAQTGSAQTMEFGSVMRTRLEEVRDRVTGLPVLDANNNPTYRWTYRIWDRGATASLEKFDLRVGRQTDLRRNVTLNGQWQQLAEIVTPYHHFPGGLHSGVFFMAPTLGKPACTSTDLAPLTLRLTFERRSSSGALLASTEQSWSGNCTISAGSRETIKGLRSAVEFLTSWNPTDVLHIVAHGRTDDGSAQNVLYAAGTLVPLGREVQEILTTGTRYAVSAGLRIGDFGVRIGAPVRDVDNVAGAPDQRLAIIDTRYRLYTQKYAQLSVGFTQVSLPTNSELLSSTVVVEWATPDDPTQVRFLLGVGEWGIGSGPFVDHVPTGAITPEGWAVYRTAVTDSLLTWGRSQTLRWVSPTRLLGEVLSIVTPENFRVGLDAVRREVKYVVLEPTHLAFDSDLAGAVPSGLRFPGARYTFDGTTGTLRPPPPFQYAYGLSNEAAHAVSVYDRSGQPIRRAGIPVSLTLGATGSAPGGGTLESPTVTTDANGRATFYNTTFPIHRAPPNTLAYGVGYRLVPTSPGLVGQPGDPFQVMGPPSKLDVGLPQPMTGTALGDADARTAGALHRLAVAYLDTNGVATAGSPVTMTARLLRADGSVVEGGIVGETRIAGGAAGGTFVNLRFARTGGPYRVEVTGLGVRPDTSAAFSVVGGTSSGVALTGPAADTSVVAGTRLGLVAQVLDALGNATAANGESVRAALLPITGGGAGKLLGDSVVTSTSGVSTFTALAIDKVGTYRMQVWLPDRSGGVRDTSVLVTVTPSTATALAIASQPRNGAFSVNFTTPLVVQLVDAYGNAVAQSGVAITLAKATGTGTASGTLSGTTDANGRVAFNAFQVSSGGTYTFSATATGLTSATSANVVVTGAPATMTFVTSGRVYRGAYSFTESSTTIHGFLPNDLLTRSTAAGTPGNTSSNGAFIVQVLDGANAAVSGAVVRARLVTPSGAAVPLAGDTVATTDGSGNASFAGLRVRVAGRGYRLEFSVLDFPSVNVTTDAATPFNVITEQSTIPVATIEIVQQPTDVPLYCVEDERTNGSGFCVSQFGVPFKATSAVTIRMRDAYGNILHRFKYPDVTGVEGAVVFRAIVPWGGSGLNYYGSLTNRRPAYNCGGTPSTLYTFSGGGSDVGFTTNPDSTVTIRFSSGCVGTGRVRISSGTGDVTSATFRTLGLPSGLAFGQAPIDGPQGIALSPAVTVRQIDAEGRTVPTTAPVTLTLVSPPAGVTLTGGTATNAVDGVATFSGLVVNSPATGLVLRATTAKGDTLTSSPFNISATGATASRLAFVTQPQTIQPNATFASPVAVAVTDATGARIRGATDLVTLTVTQGATLTGTAAVAAVDGLATFPGLTLATPGQGYTLTATATLGGSTTVVSSPFNVTATTASVLTVTLDSAQVRAGDTLAPVRVRFFDANGNRMRTGLSGSVRLRLGTNPGTATLTGTTSRVVQGDEVVFDDLWLDRAGTGYTLVAEASGLSDGTSGAFTVSALSTPASLRLVNITTPELCPRSPVCVSTQESSTTRSPPYMERTFAQGLYFPEVEVEVVDRFGNRVPNYTRSISYEFASGGAGSATLRSRPWTPGVFDDSVAVAASGNARFPLHVMTASGFRDRKLRFFVKGTALAVTTTESYAATGTLQYLQFRDARLTARAGQPIEGLTLVLADSIGQTRPGTPSVQAPAGTVTLQRVAGPQLTLGGTVKRAITQTPDGEFVARFDDVTLPSAGANFRLRASFPSALSTAGDAAEALELRRRITTTTTLQAKFNGEVSALSPLFSVSGTAASLAFVTQPSAIQVDSVLPRVRVEVRDAGGQRTSFSGTATIGTVDDNGLAGVLLADVEAGVAEFGDLRFTRASTGVRLVAKLPGVGVVESNAFDVRDPPVATTLGFTGQPVGGSVNRALTGVRVAVRDATGATMSVADSVRVTVWDAVGNTIVSAVDTVAVSVSAGEVTVPSLAIPTAGQYKLKLSGLNLTAVESDPFSVTSGAATALRFVSATPSVILRSANNDARSLVRNPTPIVVEVVDAQGVRVTDQSVTVTLDLKQGTTVRSWYPAGSSSIGAVSATTQDGVVTFRDLGTTAVEGAAVLEAKATGLTTATSASFTVRTLALRLEDVRASYALGGVWPALTARTIGVSGSDTLAVALPEARIALTLLEGTTSFSANFFGTRAGTFSADNLVFADLQANRTASAAFVRAELFLPGQTTAINQFNSSTFAIGAQAGAQVAALSWSKQPKNITALAPDTVTVTVADAFGAPIAGSAFSGAVTLRLAPTTVTPAPVLRMAGVTVGDPVTVQAVNGVATFAGITVDRVGTYQLIAAADGLTASQSQPFGVQAGERARLRVLPMTAPLVTGQDLVLNYEILDAAGNVVSTGLPSSNNQLYVTQFAGQTSGVQWFEPCGRDTPDWFNASSANRCGNPFSGVTTGTGSLTVFRDYAPRLVNPSSGGRSLLLRVWYRNGSTSNSAALTDTLRIQIASTTPTRLGFEAAPTSPGAGFTLPPVRVAIQDAGSVRVAAATGDVTVALQGGASGATVSGTLTRAAVNGVATFDDLRISAAGTGYTLRATAANLTAATSASFDVGTGPAALAVLDSTGQRVTGPIAVASAERLPTLRVTGVDGSDALFPGFTGTVSLRISAPNVADTLTAEVANGFARFDGLLFNRAETYTLTAVQGSLTSAPITVTVAPGTTAASMRFVSQPSDLASGSTALPSITVRAEDANSNVVVGASGTVTLALAVAPTGETLGGTVTQPFVNGVATFSDLVLSTGALGPYRLRATSSVSTIAPASVLSQSFAVRGGAASRIDFATAPQAGVVNAALAPAPVVRVLDAGGSVLTSATGTVTLQVLEADGTTVASGVTLTGGSVTLTNGVATFAAATLGTAGTYRLRATFSVNGNDLTITSGLLTVSAAASGLAVIQQPPRQVRVGQTLAPMVRAELRDAQGRRVRATGVTVTLRAETVPPTLQASQSSGRASRGRVRRDEPFLFRDLTDRVPTGASPIPARREKAPIADGMAMASAALRSPTEGTDSEALVSTITRTSVDGVVTFSDLTLETLGQDVVFVLEAEALTSATTSPVTVVADLPSAPTLTAVFSRSTGALVQFTPPTSDGGAAIVNYEYSTSGGVTWVPASPATTASPLLIPGLAPASQYSVQLRAVNGQGAGAASNMVVVTVGSEPPAKPTLTTATANANATLTLAVTIGSTTNLNSWEYSADDGVTWFAATGTVATTTTLTSSRTIIPGPLQVRVRGVSTAAGPGLPSDPVALVAVTAPLAPVNLQAVAGNKRFRLSFEASPNDGGQPITRYEYCVTQFAGYCANQYLNTSAQWREVSLTALPLVVTAETDATNRALVNTVNYDLAVRAVNSVGTGLVARDTVRPLNVNPPGAPVLTAVRPWDQSLRVSFTAPTSTGGATITNYEYSTDNGVTWVAPSPAQTTSPLTIPGLTNGTAYQVVLRAVNVEGPGTASNMLPGTPAPPLPPGAPPTPTVTPGATPGTIVITIPPLPDPLPEGTGEPETYTVTVSPGTGSPPTPETCTITRPATSCTVSGLPDGVPQTVTVVGTNPGGTSPASEPSTPVRPGVPGVPAAPTARPTNGGVIVTVVPPTTGGTPSSYTVTAQPGGATCTVTAPETSCTVPGLTNGTPYTVTVTATNPTGTSQPSAPSAAVTPVAAMPPSVPTITNVQPWETSLRLAFTAPTEDGGAAITNYEFSIDSGRTWVAMSPAQTTSPLRITGLTNGTTYFVSLRAVNAAGAGAAAPVVSGVPATPPAPAPVPAPPTVTPGASPGTIVVTLPPLPDSLPAGTGEAEEYIPTAQPSQTTCSIVPPATSCTLSGVPDGVPQTVTVVAKNPGGESPPSTPTAPVSAGLPAAPGVPTVTPTDGGLVVTVVPPTTGGTPSTYTVTAQPGGATCTVTAPATSCTVTGLTNGTPYTVTVTATNAVGTSSASGASEPVMPLDPPSAPQQVQASVGGPGAIRVRWQAPSNLGTPTLNAYIVELSIDGGVTWTLGATVTDISVRSVDITGLTNSLQYRARVIGRSAAGRGAPGVAPEPATPAPPVLQSPETGEPVRPDTNEIVFYEGGRTTPLQVEVVESRTLRFSGGDFSLTMSGLGPNGEPLPIDEQSRTLRAQLAAQVQVEGSGFLPGSVAHLWFFSTPVRVGQVEVDSSGRFAMTVAVPDSIGAGRHTVQVNGVSADTAERSLSLALVVSEALGVPASAAADAGPGNATVTWETPQPLGAGVTITGYVIEFRAEGSTTWTRRVVNGGELRRAVIDGLEPGTSYTFRVAAQTADGLSGWREITTPVVPLSTTPRVEVTTVLSRLTPAIGDTLTVTITVKNTGYVPVENFTLSAEPNAPRLRVLSRTPSVGSVDPATLRWLIPVLQPDATATLTISAVVIVPPPAVEASR